MGLFLLDGKGSFDKGFSVSLKVYDGGSPSLGAMVAGEIGQLPPAPDLPELDKAWRMAYRNYLEVNSYNPNDRTAFINLRPVKTNISGDHEEWERQKQQGYNNCKQAEKKLLQKCNYWLNYPDFSDLTSLKSILEKYLFAAKDKANRILIESNDQSFKGMVWQKWDLLQGFPGLEVGLSSPKFEKRDIPVQPKEKVRVLVLLGKDANIGEELDKLDPANIEFKQVSALAELDEPLWNEAWDVLIFNGHSSSWNDGTEGQFELGDGNKLEISEIRNHINQAIAKGLKLVIFNSCDGLGLAHQLGEGQGLYLPQVIVMRELLPIPLAPVFLKYFFEEVIKGVPLYSAVRASRDRLTIYEKEFPFASWLPVICQNQAEIPLIFKKRRPPNPPTDPDEEKKRKLLKFLLDKLNKAERAMNFEIAINVGEKILELDSQHKIASRKTASAYKQRILKYYNQGKYDLVIQDCDRAINLNPEDSDFYYQRARAYHQKKNFPEVIEDCNQALKLKKEADYYWVRGKAYFNQSNYDQAIKDARTSISTGRRKSDYHYLLGLSFYQKGYLILLELKDPIFAIYDLEKSSNAIELCTQGVNALSEAIKINPDQVPNYYWVRGLCYFGSGKHDQAIKDFTQANQLDRDSTNYDHNYLLGLCYYYKCDYSQAIFYLGLGIVNKKANSEYYHYLSLSYFNRDYSAKQNHDQSQHLLAMCPDLRNTFIFDSFYESDLKKAQQYNQKAMEKDKSKLEYFVVKNQIEERIRQRT